MLVRTQIHIQGLCIKAHNSQGNSVVKQDPGGLNNLSIKALYLGEVSLKAKSL